VYYRGDDFEILPGPRSEDTYAGPATYEGAYPGAPGANPGGFLAQLGETLGAFAAFYTPFVPVIAPALAAAFPAGATVVSKLGKGEEALRAITAATTIAPGATTTGPEATSSAPSPVDTTTSKALQEISSRLQLLQQGTYSQVAGPSEELSRLGSASPAPPAPARLRSRASRASPRLSARQRKILLQEALRQALQ